MYGANLVRWNGLIFETPMFFSSDAENTSTIFPSTCETPNIVKIILASNAADPAIVVGDPHLVGLRGQKFDFTGQNQATYNLVSDGSCDIINMRVTALPGTPMVTYITGLGMVLCGDSGERHTVEIEVNDPHNLAMACPTGDVCLAEGAITLKLDDDEYNRPGEVGRCYKQLPV